MHGTPPSIGTAGDHVEFTGLYFPWENWALSYEALDRTGLVGGFVGSGVLWNSVVMVKVVGTVPSDGVGKGRAVLPAGRSFVQVSDGVGFGLAHLTAACVGVGATGRLRVLWRLFFFQDYLLAPSLAL